MYIGNGVVALEVANQIIAVTQADKGYIWTTERSSGKESNVLEALKKATQQAVKEARLGA